MYVVFDTETTGLAQNFNAPWTDLDNWPRMVQLAWCEYDADGKKTAEHNHIILPDGYTIPQQAINIHRITNEIAHEQGIPVLDALQAFKEALERNDYLIAHNIRFDLGVVGSELARAQLTSRLATIYPVDTMKLTIDFCQLKSRGNSTRFKYPNLKELYFKLFNRVFEDAHNAIVDVKALGECFFELQKRDIIRFRDKPVDGIGDFSSDSSGAAVAQSEVGKPLVHFSCHTFYSLLTGAGSTTDYLKRAKEMGHPAVCVTDIDTLSASVEIWQKSKKFGVKTIFGIEMKVNDNLEVQKGEADYVVKLIIKDKQGYANLNKLLYLSHTDGFDGKTSRIKTDWLLENREGLILMCGNHDSTMAAKFFMGKKEDAVAEWKRLKDAFGDDMVAEIRFSELDEQKRFNNFTLKMASQSGTMTILGNDVHYARPEDRDLQDVVTAIRQGRAMKDCRLMERRNLYYTDRAGYFKLNKQLGYNYPENVLSVFMDNTLILAERCNFVFEVGVEKFPRYEVTKDVSDYFKTEDTEEIITKLAHAKLKQKLKKKIERGKIQGDEETIKKYVDRLNYEIGVIRDKKMLDYFLVNWEMLRDYRSKGFETGSARGSAAGCLLSWCLDITKIDPLQFGLYFERFMNPVRKAIADIDIDCMSGTDHIIHEFLINKYSKARVFPVGNFGTFNERGCLKDVVRAFKGQEETGNDSDVALVSKEMPDFAKVEYDLKYWFENHPQSDECSPNVKRWLLDPANKPILETTLKLQGQVRQFGQHAAGMVITPGPSWEYLPTNISSKGTVTSAFQEADGSSKDLSLLGILKLDILKLSSMNVIMECIRLIKEDTGKDLFDEVMSIDEKFDDPNLYHEVMLGQNYGVFQFESPGMNSLLSGIKVERFDELAAANALYRPGPMGIGAHKEYIDNKRESDKIRYLHPLLEPILSETNGVMIYQEQVQFIANKIAGMNLGEGDILRRCMDKASKIIKKTTDGVPLSEDEKNDKNYVEFLKVWDKFLNGAKEQGLSEYDVEQLKNYLIKYLGYSFNKSHSVSYAFIAMQTIFLKHYYPTYFYTALLNKGSEGGDKTKKEERLVKTITAAIGKGIDIKPPSRKSEWEYAIMGEKEIGMGFNSLNGFGDIAYEELKTLLKQKKKTLENITMASFFDLPFSKFNITAFKACVHAGMFDDWSNSREYLLHLKTKKRKAAIAGQIALFDVDEIAFSSPIDSAKFPNTSDSEKNEHFRAVCGFDLNYIAKLSRLHQQVVELGNRVKQTYLPLLQYEEPGYYWFVLQDMENKKDKNGKMYMKVKVGDGISNTSFNLFGIQRDKLLPELERQGVYIAKFKKTDSGFFNLDARGSFKKIGHTNADKLFV